MPSKKTKKTAKKKVKKKAKKKVKKKLAKKKTAKHSAKKPSSLSPEPSGVRMATMTQDFRQLNVWKKAHELTLEVYRRTKSFPSDERYGLSRQLQRSACSIGSNLAEGCGSDTDPGFRRFVVIALGSASELEYRHMI